MSTQFEAPSEATPASEPQTPLERAVQAVRKKHPRINYFIGADSFREVLSDAIAEYESIRRPEWSEVMIATVEQERDTAREERDRARATAVRLEQEMSAPAPVPGYTVYVAGPMTGLPEFNYPAFREAATELTLRGYEVLCPVDSELENPTPGVPQSWEWYMRRALAMVVAADGVALLPGWEASRGAQIEVTIAKALGMEIREFDKWVRS